MFQFHWSLICMTEACVAASSNLLGDSRSHYLGDHAPTQAAAPGAGRWADFMEPFWGGGSPSPLLSFPLLSPPNTTR